jgi:hypothetical protein
MATATKEEKQSKSKEVQITAPNFVHMILLIRGIAPLVINNFSKKAKEQMRRKQEAGSAGKSRTKREPKDFNTCFEEAKHRSTAGWDGIAASSFRNAMISACRACGYKMTHAKLAVHVVAEGYDKDDPLIPLVKISKGEAIYTEMATRNETGVADIRARPMYAPGWEAEIKIRYDADMFTQEDVLNLMMRVGLQVGIGEGRPDSKKSAGMGWGLFEIVEK